MPIDPGCTSVHVDRQHAVHSRRATRRTLAPTIQRPPASTSAHGGAARISREGLQRRWRTLSHSSASAMTLADPLTLEQAACYQGHIENFIGTVKVPVGVAGPLRVNGLFACGDYSIPLATTEAALVASYNRGARLISAAGGCSAMLLAERLGRAPGFAFHTLEEGGRFVSWAVEHVDAFRRVARTTTRYGRLADMQVAVEGNHVYLHFTFTTGDAAGQNMVTIASEAIRAYIVAHSPVTPRYSFVEANLSGDKKACAQSFQSVRGKKVTAEVSLPAALVQRQLRTTPRRMAEYWRMGALGSILSGAIGAQGHYANGLAALYIACGQDAACVAESAVGVTRLEVTPTGALYAAVTLPNLIVGTIGGGTGLPSQAACLDVLGLSGPGNARALAEVCAALCLAGEISLIGALCAGDFTSAHQRLARGAGASGPDDTHAGVSSGPETAARAAPASLHAGDHASGHGIPSIPGRFPDSAGAPLARIGGSEERDHA